MDKIPCTGNDATGNQYRVTNGHGGIRLCKDAQFGATSTKVLKTTYCINKIKNGYKDVERKIKLLTH